MSVVMIIASLAIAPYDARTNTRRTSRMNLGLLATGLTSAVVLSSFSLGASEAIAQTLDFEINYDTEFNLVPLGIARPEVVPPTSLNLTPIVESLPAEVRAILPPDLPSTLETPTYLDVFGSGTSVETDVPFGLTNFTSDTFGLPITLASAPDPTTGEPIPVSQLVIFRANPQDIGLDLPAPELSDIYFGEGTDNKLFGFANDQAVINVLSPTEGTVQGGGLISVTAGEGAFEGATGEIMFTQSDVFDPSNMGGPLIGQAVLKFSIETPSQSVPEADTQAAIVGLGIVGMGTLLRRRSHLLS